MSAVQFKTFSQEEQAAAPQLEPSLESLLRSHGVHESVIMACRCQDVVTRSVFVALDSSEEGLKDTAREAFGIDVSQGFPHKRKFAKTNFSAWKKGRLQADTKAKVDAVTRAHGEHVTQLPADWESMMTKFKAKFGLDIPEFHLPGQSYLKPLEEKLNEGRLKPETLAQAISMEEEEEMERKKPEGPKHLSLTLDAQFSGIQ